VNRLKFCLLEGCYLISLSVDVCSVGGVSLAGLWSRVCGIVLAPIVLAAAGCSADSSRFGDDSSRGQGEATGTIAGQPTSRRAAGGTWIWDGGTAVTVARGDSVDTIAHRHHVPASVIVQANNLKSPGTVRPGQRLVIPRYSAAPISVAPQPPVVGAAVLIPPASIPDNGGGVATGAGASLGTPQDTPIVTSRHVASPVTAKASGGRTIVQPLKVASAPQPAKPAPVQHAAPPAAPRKLAVAVAPPEKPAAVDPVKPGDPAPSFHWPVRGQVIAGFGPKTDGQRNNGIDIAVPENTPIKAADDGVVIYSGNELKSFGNLVLVRHNNDYITAYAHAKELRVKRGDSIKSGEIIGMSGQTGNIETPQIHFEIRKGSTPVDPMQLLHGA
jgi:murein DD-endopeptidase MepM/ murein hydrolase activator NlpD